MNDRYSTRKKSARKQETWKPGPALASYIARIGAEMRNFRRLVVRLEGRDLYHYDAVIITLTNEGDINCPDPEYAPTDDERAAVKKEYEGIELPQSESAGEKALWDLRKLLREKNGSEPELYVFADPSGERATFVQQRVRKEDGGKDDLPWSYWSDKEWRMMEPDGDLPLFGLERLSKAGSIIIHEGAKTAHYVNKMIEKPEKHPSPLLRFNPDCSEFKWLKNCPWIEDLENSTHLGWPGGAPNPHRVDWEPIRKLPPYVPVVIILDHDMSGENAGPKISRYLQRHCQVIRFGEAFPVHFDLADEFPSKMLEEKKGRKVYIGPSFKDCLQPATRATRKFVIKDDKKKEITRSRYEMSLLLNGTA